MIRWLRPAALRLAGAAVTTALVGGAVVALLPAPAQAAGCAPRTGPSQRQVERYLGLPVDGVASVSDCLAVRRFQRRMDIRPAAGYAGPLTGSVAARLAGAALGSCGYSTGVRVCVDLTHQVMWVTRSGKRIRGPVPIRTGRANLRTPSGNFRILGKKVSTTSTIFKGVPLPYWERFHLDMGFHETPSWLYAPNTPGSHGCINLLPADAKALFKLTRIGTPVRIFGRKPGT
jgi:peptidoglycan hydrolase-like protein with peptidoglycan-binding domain